MLYRLIAPAIAASLFVVCAPKLAYSEITVEVDGGGIYEPMVGEINYDQLKADLETFKEYTKQIEESIKEAEVLLKAHRERLAERLTIIKGWEEQGWPDTIDYNATLNEWAVEVRDRLMGPELRGKAEEYAKYVQERPESLTFAIDHSSLAHPKLEPLTISVENTASEDLTVTVKRLNADMKSTGVNVITLDDVPEMIVAAKSSEVFVYPVKATGSLGTQDILVTISPSGAEPVNINVTYEVKGSTEIDEVVKLYEAIEPTRAELRKQLDFLKQRMWDGNMDKAFAGIDLGNLVVSLANGAKTADIETRFFHSIRGDHYVYTGMWGILESGVSASINIAENGSKGIDNQFGGTTGVIERLLAEKYPIGGPENDNIWFTYIRDSKPNFIDNPTDPYFQDLRPYRSEQ